MQHSDTAELKEQPPAPLTATNGGLKVVEGYSFGKEVITMNEKKRYYIAYGSNLNVEQMMRRCPGAKPIGTAMLEHNILYFRGSGSGYYLTIEPKIGSKVPVAVWEVTPEDEEALDRYEGYPRFYFKYDYTLKVTLLDEKTTKELRCFAYVMTEDRRVGLPTNYYLTTCMKGYRDFGFDTKILIRTVERMKKILWKQLRLK